MNKDYATDEKMEINTYKEQFYSHFSLLNFIAIHPLVSKVAPRLV